MSGFGSFSQEAYDQLKEAYASQLLEAEEIEKAGVKIGQDTLGVETAPFKADWLDKTGLWKYPDGKGDYTDRKQTPEDLLAALRDGDGNVAVAAEEESDEELDLDALSDEELDAYIDEIMASIDEEEGDADDSESDDEEDEAMSDEELDALVNSILEGVDGDTELTDDEIDALVDRYFEGNDEESDDEEERLDEDFNADGMGDMIGEEDDDAISIADKIAALKAELAELSAGLDVEETDESEEEPTEAVEETDSEEDPIEEEEVTSDDEPA